MKNLIFFSILIITSTIAPAQSHFSLVEGQSGLVYSLPKTQLCVEVLIEKKTQKPGLFYRYCERFLATNNVITEEKTTFKLKNIKVKTNAIADTNRTYSIISDKNSQLSKISVNSDGILCGVNVTAVPKVEKEKTVEIPQKEIAKPSTLLPLGEEYMMAGSEAKLAEGAAKQIYRIRESRLGLLTADGEKIPADGASMKSMLDGLDKMERELTELFVGKTTSDWVTENICLTPDSTINNQVLFRLSTLLGLVSKDDLSGTPYFISIVPDKFSVTPADPKAKLEKVGIYTVLPAVTQVSIGDGIITLYNNTFFIPQFGNTIPLPESLFKQHGIKVHVDLQTGRLLNIE